MRLRVVVRRHALPDTPIVWDIDTQHAAPIISTLLEEINDVVPIETTEWGLEDYAVEIKGKDGVNFELLHFQPVAKVLHEDDELIIRPLLTHDLRVRRISGRHQISTDGKHLVDGIAFGRPLLRKPAGRPAINIPPRKKRRITYDEDEDGNEVPLTLEGTKEAAGTSEGQLVAHEDWDNDDDSEDDEDFEPGQDGDEDEDNEADAAEDMEDGNRQLVIHADFLDEDEEDDEDFEIGDSGEQDESDKEDLDDEMDAEASEKLQEDIAAVGDEEALQDIPDVEDRARILALAEAFPKAKTSLCKLIYLGTNGDMEKAYTALIKGFKPSISRSVVVGSMVSAAPSTPGPKTRSKKKKKKKSSKFTAIPTGGGDEGSAEKVSSEITRESEAELPKEKDKALLEYYDQNGLPPGSIKSGTALSYMATVAAKNPSTRSRQRVSRPASPTSNKSVPFEINRCPSQASANSLLEADSGDDEASEKVSSDVETDHEDKEASEESSSEEDSSGTSSESSDSDSSSGEDLDEAKVADDAASTTDSDSSSDSSSSSSDSESDSEPDEVSSKAITTSGQQIKVGTGKTATSAQPTVRPGRGLNATKKRNQRRRTSNALHRLKEKGILPAGTTTAELARLKGVDNQTNPEFALAALEAVRASWETVKAPEKSTKAAAKDAEFEARRRELLASLASGGVEVGNQSLPVIDQSYNAEGNAASVPAQTAQIVDPKNTEMKIASPPVNAAPKSSDVEMDESEQTRTEPNELISSHSNVQAKDGQVAGSSPAVGNVIPESSSPQPAPLSASTESTQNSSAPRRRAKLDLGAGRRLLFGALGIKTPKNKFDEDKVRSDLMKYVRPEKAKEPTPEPSTEVNENEDPDAWKEKIIYRAVECCHDGIELSQPPFPFVQRWDPQQQGSWSYNGKRGGKRKKSQRDQSQFYNEEGSASKRQKRKCQHTYAETQESVDASFVPTPFEQQEEYLDASYVPSHQEDSMILESLDAGNEGQTQQSELHSDDVDGQISEQLMHDVSAISTDDPFSLASQGVDEDDLPALPGNVTSLPDLKAEDPKIGMVIAFKQLIMSEVTKWQPQMSNYRTAVVIKVSDRGDLELTLAKRDRVQSNKQYDEDTGERIYGKFDMPDDDDEQDDDGYLNLPFSELVEPKLVQAAPPSLSAEQSAESPTKAGGSTDDSTTLPHEDNSDHQEHQKQHEDDLGNQEHHNKEENQQESMVPETQVPEDTPEAPPADESQQPDLYKPATDVDAEVAQPDTPSIDKDPQPETNLPDESVNVDVTSPASMYESAPVIPDALVEPPSEGTKQEITNMIKEAGFRSSVPSSVLRDIRPNGKESPGDAAIFEKLMKDMGEIEKGSSYSPKFNGFGSSPPRANAETEESSPIRGPRRREPAENRALQTSYATANEEASSGQSTSFGPTTSLDNTYERASSTSVHYPKLSVASSVASQVSDHGRQPDFEVPDDDTMQLDDSEYSILKRYDAAASVDELELPPKSVNDAGESIPTSSPARATSSSDDDLPSLEEVFASQSQIKRESQTPHLSQPSMKISKEYDAAVAALSDEDSDQPTPKASQNRTRPTKRFPGLQIAQAKWEALQPRKKETLSGALKDAKSGSRKSAFSQSQPAPKAASQSQTRSPPKASQPKDRVSSSQPVTKGSQSQKMVIPQGSQVWDLTMSNSDVEPDTPAKKRTEPQSDDDSDDAYFKKFKKYDSDEDEDFVLDEGLPKGSGWKHKNIGGGRTTRRRTSELAAAPQPTRNSRRKTTGGF